MRLVIRANGLYYTIGKTLAQAIPVGKTAQGGKDMAAGVKLTDISFVEMQVMGRDRG